MSTVIMTACWPLQGMSATHKAVLISLADNANDDGVCWPSVQRISERTCLSERAVRNALRWLETAKAISSNQRYGRSSWYTITPAHYAPGTTCPPAPDAPQPRHDVPLTPAPRAPRTVKEPSVEPSEVVDEPKAVVPKLEPQKIVDLFNEILSHELPAVTLLNDDRKAKLKARWNQHPAHQCLGFWADYFETVKASAFLMGKAPGKNGGAPFRATFDWLIAPTNFVKVVEGNYHA